MTRGAAMCQRMKIMKRYGDREYSWISLDEMNKAQDSNTTIDPEKLVPEKHHDCLPLFQEANTRKLPQHQYYNHKIELSESFKHLYSIS